MSKMVIPEGKKRYSVTMTTDNYEWLSALIKKSKLPRSHIGIVIDDLVSELRKSIQTVVDYQDKQGRELSHIDMMVLMGQKLQEVGERESKLIP
jgi:phosphoribosylformylglycinamidine (FGAM) synthase-like enzyme